LEQQYDQFISYPLYNSQRYWFVNKLWQM